MEKAHPESHLRMPKIGVGRPVSTVRQLRTYSLIGILLHVHTHLKPGFPNDIIFRLRI